MQAGEFVPVFYIAEPGLILLIGEHSGFRSSLTCRQHWLGCGADTHCHLGACWIRLRGRPFGYSTRTLTIGAGRHSGRAPAC